MSRPFCSKVIAIVVFSAATQLAGTELLAGHLGCQHCGAACESCQLVECTVYVPMTVMEKRVQNCVVNKTEQREETYTVFKRVPKTRKITKEVCYLQDDVRTQTITEKQCHRVMNPVVRMEHVNVYEPEVREMTVKREVCTECGKVCIEEPCTCTVMVKRPDVRIRQCQEPDVVFETTKRDISYCVKVPKKATIPCAEETVYELVPVEKKRTVSVCVPEIVPNVIEVPVKKMVPQKILCCESCRHKLGHH
jgi:hypothetical protein